MYNTVVEWILIIGFGLVIWLLTNISNKLDYVVSTGILLGCFLLAVFLRLFMLLLPSDEGPLQKLNLVMS